MSLRGLEGRRPPSMPLLALGPPATILNATTLEPLTTPVTTPNPVDIAPPFSPSTTTASGELLRRVS